MTLQEEAKSLGIKGCHLMKEETLIARIAEAKTAPVAVAEQEQVTAPTGQRIAELMGKANMLRSYLGEKSVRYLEFVSAYRHQIPDEYNRVADLIQLYLK